MLAQVTAALTYGGPLRGSPCHLGVTRAPPYLEIPAYKAILSARDPIASRTPNGQRSQRQTDPHGQGALPPLDLDDGGAGGGAVKVAGSLSLASLGDSPAVRRDAPPRSNRGRGLPFAVPATNASTRSRSPHPARPPFLRAERASSRQITARHPGTARVTPKRGGVPVTLGARRMEAIAATPLGGCPLGGRDLLLNCL